MASDRIPADDYPWDRENRPERALVVSKAAGAADRAAANRAALGLTGLIVADLAGWSLRMLFRLGMAALVLIGLGSLAVAGFFGWKLIQTFIIG